MLSTTAIALVVGALVSFGAEYLPFIKKALDKLPGKWPAVLLFVLFLGVPLAAGYAACQGVSVPGLEGATCPVSLNDWLALAWVGASAFMGSQVNHAVVNKGLDKGKG